VKWLSHWKTTKKHAEDIGCKLVCKKNEDNRCDAEKATIYIDSDLPVKQRIYILLHEIGHYRIHQLEMLAGNAYEPHHFIDINGASKISLKSRIARIREEILAWDLARSSAISLSIPLDKGFEMIKNKMLYSYLEWAVNQQNENNGNDTQ
jgi:hypothetical protein